VKTPAKAKAEKKASAPKSPKSPKTPKATTPKKQSPKKSEEKGAGSEEKKASNTGEKRGRGRPRKDGSAVKPKADGKASGDSSSESKPSTRKAAHDHGESRTGRSPRGKAAASPSAGGSLSQKEGVQLIGSKTKKQFSGKLYDGEVIGYDPKMAYYKVHDYVLLIVTLILLVVFFIWNPCLLIAFPLIGILVYLLSCTSVCWIQLLNDLEACLMFVGDFVFQVLYSDGDKEDLTLKEVRATLAEDQSTPKTRGRSKSADPAKSGEESPTKKQKLSTPKKDSAKAQSPARYSLSCFISSVSSFCLFFEGILAWSDRCIHVLFLVTGLQT